MFGADPAYVVAFVGTLHPQDLPSGPAAARTFAAGSGGWGGFDVLRNPLLPVCAEKRLAGISPAFDLASVVVSAAGVQAISLHIRGDVWAVWTLPGTDSADAAGNRDADGVV